jgi:putative transposase
LFYQTKPRVNLELDSEIPSSKKISSKRKRISEDVVDETMLKVGSEYIGLWIGIDRTRKQANSRTFLANKSNERNMFVAERFLSGIVKDYGKHPVSADSGGTWYPTMAYQFLRLDHHIHSPEEKSIIERTMQYKDRTESFDDYYPCRQKNCKLKHIRNWLNLFINYHSEEKIHP